MKLTIQDGLQCRCGMTCIYLDDVRLQDDPYGYGPFTFYIYFRCSYCLGRYRYAHKKDQTRLMIKQKHVNKALWIRDISEDQS